MTYLSNFNCKLNDLWGTLIATGSADRTVRVWDVERGYCTHNFREHTDIVQSVYFHPDPNRLLLFSCSEDNTVRIFDLRDNVTVACFRYQCSRFYIYSEISNPLDMEYPYWLSYQIFFLTLIILHAPHDNLYLSSILHWFFFTEIIWVYPPVIHCLLMDTYLHRRAETKYVLRNNFKLYYLLDVLSDLVFFGLRQSANYNFGPFLCTNCTFQILSKGFEFFWTANVQTYQDSTAHGWTWRDIGT